MAQDIHSVVEARQKEQLLSVPAQRLIEKLSLLKNRKESSRKRWFWELLQNASDYNQTVAVRLTVNNYRVIFEHDGSPFSITDVLNMISPDSNKRGDEKHADNIGKFGTGLVSTHILSSVMEVKGICLEEGEYYSFKARLDRSSYLVKEKLVEAMNAAKDAFDASLTPTSWANGFQASITYQLGTALPNLPVIKAEEVDLEYLYEVLPYTLCFMPKVREVTIRDERNGVSVFTVKRRQGKPEDVTFCIEHDGQTETQTFAYFEHKGVSSVYRYAEGAVLPFPMGISRIFCGLPLIGTEGIGLPFLLNSFKFEPTTEREGIELEPDSNDLNRSLLTESAVLYKMILDRVQSEKLTGAYTLTALTRKYNGTQASNTQFVNQFLPKYKAEILSHSIVRNERGEFIPFSQVRLPFLDSKADTALYDQSRFVASASLPESSDYKQWFEATDFSLFPDQKYTYETLVKVIEQTGSLYSFGHEVEEVNQWLPDCLGFIKQRNRYIFSQHAILPNQTGKFCLSTLKADTGLPSELKGIYNDLFAADGQKIEDELLDRDYNDLDVLTLDCRLEDLCRRIDTELANQYAKNQGDTSKINGPLNRLYTWISKSEESKENLSGWFHWYYPKRATLIVDMLNDSQREQALTIAQSGKMEALAQLAASDLTDKEIAMLTANIGRLSALLAHLNDTVDDKLHADGTRGDQGEQIVYDDLRRKYPASQGYKVVWAAKDGEPCYDFRVTKGSDVVCYCDAKTTSRGIANADSIPFFMRKSQWQFLQTLDESIPYFIARVFMGDGGQIKYMRIAKREE